MAAGKLASLLIKISADGASAEKELRTLERKMKNTAKEFEKVGRTMSKYITAPLTALAGVSVAAANTQLQAEAKLLNALKGREDAQQRLIAQAGELQSRTTLGDETIIEQQAYLASLGLTEKQIGDTIEAAAQLSTALNMDLGSAVKNLAKTYGGMTGELGEGIPALKNLTKEQLQAGDAIKYVNDNYKGFAETAAQTGAGSLIQLKNTIGDIAEQFGVILLPALQKIVAKLRDFAQWLQNLSPGWRNAIVSVGAVAAALGPLHIMFGKVITIARKLVDLFPALSAKIALSVGPIMAAVAAIAALATAWAVARSKMNAYMEDEDITDRKLARASKKIYDSSKDKSDAQIAKELADAERHLERARAEGQERQAHYYEAQYIALSRIQRERAGEEDIVAKILATENAIASTIGEQNEEYTKRSGIIADLNTKISELEKSKTAATSEAEIARINGLLEKARAELERISNLKDVEIKIAVKVDTPASANTSPLTASPALDIDGISKNISNSIAKTTAIADFREFWDNLSAEAERGAETVAQIVSTLKSSLNSLAITLGEGIGNALSENKPEDFSLKLSMLNALGNALKTLGSALVSYGIAMKEFKTALDMAWLTPGLAITAGLAAVALGQGFINKANAPIKLASGGLAYGPTLAVVGDNRGAASDPEVIAPLSKLRSYMGGQQLELVGGVAFELRGDVARAILDRENVRLNRKG